MANSRERILGSIRASLARSGHLPRAERVTLTPDQPEAREALIERFARELALVGGTCERVPRPEAVAARVAALAREAGAAEGGVLAWDMAQLPAPGLHAALTAAGIEAVGGDVPHDEPARGERIRQLETLRVGLTGADAAFADTGTLALRSGPGRPRLASLSVWLHIAVVAAEQVWPSWAAWWQAATAPNQPGGRDWVAEASNLTLITGPSRTGDIEMTLTIGVHGPRQVHVFVAG